MTITKNELIKRKDELNKELSAISSQLCDYEYNEKKEKYGDKFCCRFCKYSAVSGLSGDGWHNTCGANSCTCCHCDCDEYEPDNKVTAFIKENCKKGVNGYGEIDERYYRAFKELYLPFLNDLDENKTNKAIEIIKILFVAK